MKKMYGVVFLFLFLIPFTSYAFSGQGCGGDCIQCHKLEKKDAEDILKKLAPAGTVSDIKRSTIGGLWQVEVEVGGQKGSFFVDFAKKNIILGQRVQIIPVEDIGKPVPQRKIDFSKLPLKDAIVLGPKKASKKIAVFTDPDCPYCRQLHDSMKQVIEKRKDVAFYIFLRPLPMHKDALKKSQAVQCQKSLKLLDDAFAGKAVPEPTCSGEQIDKNNALADSLELMGTPALIRNDGAVNPGYLPADQLSSWIDTKPEEKKGAKKDADKK